VFGLRPLGLFTERAWGYIHLRPVHVDIDIDIHVLFSFLKDVRSGKYPVSIPLGLFTERAWGWI
jgi:hypothetical protein